MKKKIIFMISMIIIISIVTIQISALTITSGVMVSWQNWTSGTYVPPSGEFYSVHSDFQGEGQNDALTRVDFTFSQSNVDNIIQYNYGIHAADDKNLYFTVDISSVRSGLLDQMSAYSMKTSLPSPKFDLESDDLFGTRNEESEVVALGLVKATSYYVSTNWYDYRDGGSTDNGRWEVNCNMSGQYISINDLWISSSGDYNTIWQAGAQAIIEYSNQGGVK